MNVTRLAPSPTGALHLGNARTFLINWLLAQQQQWRILLRMEDLDGPRIKAGADSQAVDDLRWLGLDWNNGPIYQSPRLKLYSAAIETLLASGLAYPCVCSRREVESASSAPHAEDGATVYPGTCRGRFASVALAWEQGRRGLAVRFAVSPGEVEFYDEFSGRHKTDVAARLGDFVIAKALEGPPAATAWAPAYQLAVVVDDAAMGVTDVVRGDDLLDSTPRQILVYRALGLAHLIPRYTHLPLIVGADGRRLAKRHGDTRLSYYRQQGVAPSRILSLVARWCGVQGVPETLGVDRILRMMTERFQLHSINPEPITFTAQDDKWLRAS